MSTNDTGAVGTDDELGSTATDQETTDEESIAELYGKLELLQAENQRLREEYTRSQQTNYRRTAFGLLTVGVIAVAGSFAVATAQQVLIALGGTAITAGVLTYYLTPADFVTTTTGDALYRTQQTNYTELISTLDLAGTEIYVPREERTPSDTRLFLPQHYDYTLPEDADLDEMFVVTDDPSQRGVALYPTGAALFEELQTAVDLTPSETNSPEQLFTQLADALVEQFEIADRIVTSVEDDHHSVIAVTDSSYQYVDGIDHPIASFFGVGIATTLGTPARITVYDADGTDVILECRWDNPDNSKQ